MNNPQSCAADFAAYLKSLIRSGKRGEKRAKNPMLRRKIRDALGISASTLYYWCNPRQFKGEATSLPRPTKGEIILLAHILAEYRQEHREALVNAFLEKAGYPVVDKDTPLDQGETIANRFYRQFEAFVGNMFFCEGYTDAESERRIAAMCFMSQQFAQRLIRQWFSNNMCGHVFVFWTYEYGKMLSRFNGAYLDSLRRLFDFLTNRNHSSGNVDSRIRISIFLTMHRVGRDPEWELKAVKNSIACLGEELIRHIDVYVGTHEKKTNRPDQELMIFRSPLKDLAFQITEYERLRNLCNSLSANERMILQEEFDAMSWCTQATPLPDRMTELLLMDHGIQYGYDLKAPIEFWPEGRWSKMEISDSDQTQAT